MTIRRDHRYFVVAQASPETRALFIRRTYEHVALALFALFLLEMGILLSPLGGLINRLVVLPHMWLVFLGLFLAFSGWVYICGRSNRTTPTQYASLAIYLAVTPPVLVPLLARAAALATPQVIPMVALVMTLFLLSVTLAAFTTKNNFAHWKFVLKTAVFLGAGLSLAVAAFGLNPALIFAGGLVIFTAGIILATTGRILYEYAPHQYVAAAIVLLASSPVFLCRPRLGSF